jgi:biotin carboxyl carrier protein/Na+-transporting methylmalonyl-CoA/oxaloacetate decarboxylase gamma subunit
MTVSESLLVGVIGLAVVFLVLIGLIVLLRLQSALVGRFAQKRPAGVVQETPAATAPAEPAAADASVGGAAQAAEAQPVGIAAGVPPVSRSGAGVRYRGNGKYIVTVDDVAYEVEMEAEEAPSIQPGEPPRSMPAIAKVQAAAPPIEPAPAPKPEPKPAPAPKAAPVPAGGSEIVTAPVPGTVIEIKAAAGATVKRGDILVLLEAMKMENEIVAPRGGTVAQVLTSKGASVDAGAPLVEIQ